MAGSLRTAGRKFHSTKQQGLKLIDKCRLVIHGIIGISGSTSSEESLGTWLIQNQVMLQAIWKIRVRNKWPPEPDEVCPSVCKSLFRPVLRILAGINKRAFECTAVCLFKRNGHNGSIIPIGLRNMDIRNAKLIEHLCCCDISFFRMIINSPH